MAAKLKVDFAIVACLYCVALAARLVPLTVSTLPYNVDGFSLVKITAGIDASGTWRINETAVIGGDTKLPVFSLLWNAQVQLAGLNPLEDIQWFLPILTAWVVLPIYLIGVKGTGSRLVGLLSGLFLSLFGTFLFLTSSVMKESLALLLLPVALLTFHERADPRKRAIASVLLLVLVFLHHVTTLMAAGMVGSLILLEHRRALFRGRFSGRRLGLDVATGLGPFLAAWIYYSAVKLTVQESVSSSLDELVLFVALTVFLAALLARVSRPASMPVRRRFGFSASPILIVGVAIGGVLVNASWTIFPGTTTTTPALLLLLVPLGLLAGFALVGYHVIRRTANRLNDLVVSIFVAPIAFILFGFLRGLDSLSHVIVYRAFDFMDFAFALCAGVGLAMIGRRLAGRRSVLVALTGLFLAALLATTPMAWNTQEVFRVQTETTPEEFRALALLSSWGVTRVGADEHLNRVGTSWFGMDVDQYLPVRLANHEPITGYDYALILERWTTVGADEYPGPRVVVDHTILEEFLSANRVLYVAGPPGDRIFVVQLVAPS